jgi:hypothetical protein
MKSLKFSANCGMSSADANLSSVSSDIRILNPCVFFLDFPSLLVIQISKVMDGGYFYAVKKAPDRAKHSPKKLPSMTPGKGPFLFRIAALRKQGSGFPA